VIVVVIVMETAVVVDVAVKGDNACYCNLFVCQGTNDQSKWMNQVLFKTCNLIYITMSKTKYNPVQSIYTVLASVCSTWRAKTKLTPAFTNALRQCFNNIGCILLIIECF